MSVQVKIILVIRAGVGLNFNVMKRVQKSILGRSILRVELFELCGALSNDIRSLSFRIQM